MVWEEGGKVDLLGGREGKEGGERRGRVCYSRRSEPGVEVQRGEEKIIEDKDT